ncbi:MAG: redoxin domain-containing protein [Bacteroidetes bacterium]|nr:redoxin domain-containing protein [Bacteroidota bacterium]
MEIGDKFIEFNLKGADGKVHNVYEYADKYALCIVFTCNSCDYSKSYGQRLIKLLNKYEHDSFGIIGINSNDAAQSPEDSFEEMKRISAKLGLETMNFMYLHDEDQSIAKAYGAATNPEVFLFNSKRELVYHGAIDDNWQNATLVTRVYLEDAIEYCLDGLEVDFPEVKAEGCPIIWKK